MKSDTNSKKELTNERECMCVQKNGYKRLAAFSIIFTFYTEDLLHPTLPFTQQSCYRQHTNIHTFFLSFFLGTFKTPIHVCIFFPLVWSKHLKYGQLNTLKDGIN